MRDLHRAPIWCNRVYARAEPASRRCSEPAFSGGGLDGEEEVRIVLEEQRREEVLIVVVIGEEEFELLEVLIQEEVTGLICSRCRGRCRGEAASVRFQGFVGWA